MFVATEEDNSIQARKITIITACKKMAKNWLVLYYFTITFSNVMKFIYSRLLIIPSPKDMS
jgi:hypothetical protein